VDTKTCVSCAEPPDRLPLAIICVVVTGCVAWLAWDIWRSRRGHRWAATLVGGIIFGWIVEFVNTHDVVTTHHIYCYPDSPINLGTGVPYWVPVGWGGIIYAANWTAQRLRLHPCARPFAAAFLTASIDFSLDPVSKLLRFWTWECFPVNFVGVPYDNFVGWYLIVYVYSLSAAWVLGATKKHWNLQGLQSAPTLQQKRTSVVIEWLAPFACAAVATVLFLGFEWALSRNQSYSGDDGRIAATIFMLATAVGIGVTVFLAKKPAAAKNEAPNWPVIVVPALIHLTCYGLFLAFLFEKNPPPEPLLVASIPIQLLAGLFVFSAHWRRRRLLHAAYQAKARLVGPSEDPPAI